MFSVTVEWAGGPYCLDANCSSSNFQEVVWEDRGGSSNQWYHTGVIRKQLQYIQF